MSDAGDRAPPDAPSPDAEAEALAALELLWQRREPYQPLLAEIVRDTLAEFTPRGDGMVLELGAGSGALRACLPAALRERAVHTDPSAAALRALRERAPHAKTREARAELLPFDAGSAAAVLGLCVFDALHDEAAAVGELARVLGPGDRFFHFLDMATLLEAPFAKLAAGGLVPLPNVFGDPADSAWPLDLVLVQRDWLTGLLRWAVGAGHPLGTAFGGYFGAFLDAPFDVTRATAVWKAIASSAQRRHELKVLLESAAPAAFRAGHPAIQPLPFHSGRYLQSVLDTAFGAGSPFVVERSDIVARAAWGQFDADAGADGHARRYRSLCLGHQRLDDEFPRRLLTAAATARVATGQVQVSETLTELAVFVFVARRR